MKKTLLTSAIFMALTSTATLAHHPAADIVDPEIYAMIDENVADTPHADLTFDDMGRDMDDMGAAMESRQDMESMDGIMESRQEMGDFGAAMESREDMGAAMESRQDMGELASDGRGPLSEDSSAFMEQRGETESLAEAVDAEETIGLLDGVLSGLAD